MNALFNEYKDSGNITEALLVGRNMVNKSPGDSECVAEYVDFLLALAGKLPSLEERKKFWEQANITISFYEENVELTKEVINNIFDYRRKLEKIAVDIVNAEQKRSIDSFQQILEENEERIKKLYVTKQKIENVKTREEFDEMMQDIASIDSELDHENLTDKQMGYYNRLNKECTELISKKMFEFERISNIEYNRKAVEAYDSAFRKFKDDEKKYKNQTQLFSLVSTTLFAYDASRLFNETLIYFNHVYSYIFGKLDDNGKFALTRFSIECERKMR